MAIILILVAAGVGGVLYYVAYSTQPITCPAGYTKVVNQCVANSQSLSAYTVGYTYTEVNAYATGSTVTTSGSAYTLFSPGAMTSMYVNGAAPNLNQVTSLFGASNYKTIASGSTPTNWNVQPADNDKAFLSVHPGTQDYLNIAGFQGNSWVLCNDGTTNCANSAKGKWMPVSSQTIYDIVFEINTRTQNPLPTASPPNFDFSITFPEYVEFSSGITLNGPTTPSVAAASTNYILEWSISGLTTNYGFEISQITLANNVTTSAAMAVTINSLTISGNGPVYIGPGYGETSVGSADPTPQITGNGQYVLSVASSNVNAGGVTNWWSFWGQAGQNQPGNGILVTNPSSTNGKTVIDLSLTTTNVPTAWNGFKLTITGVGPDGTSITAVGTTVNLVPANYA